MKLAIGADHAGYEYKAKLLEYLSEKNYDVKNYGTDSPDSVDYPDFAHPVASSVEDGTSELGILICGSANGVAMAANKHQGIRAAICWNEELASLSRQHNNANILCLPSRFIAYELAVKIVDTFLTEKFEGGRHDRRVNKICC